MTYKLLNKAGGSIKVSEKVLYFLQVAGVLPGGYDSTPARQLVAADKPYNGWPNHATWVVHLHLTNTQSSDLYARELASLVKGLETIVQVEKGVWTRAEGERFTLASRLESWVKDQTAVTEQERVRLARNRDCGDVWPLLITDLVSSYLADVNWNSIADAFLED